MYPTPEEPEPEAIVSTCPITVELEISILKIWPRTGATSFELGFTVTLILSEVAPSTFDTADIIAELIFISPVL